METVSDLVQQYGYWGIFIGLVLGIIIFPIPDESMLTCAGYYVYKGQLQFGPTLGVAILGCICGITVSYGLGRSLGFFVVHKYGRYIGITDEKIQRTHYWYEHKGKWALVFGYYIPGIRHLTAFMAGTTKLEFHVFALYSYFGGLLWSLGFITLGYCLGNQWEAVLNKIQSNLTTATVVLMIGAGLYFLIRNRISQKETRP